MIYRESAMKVRDVLRQVGIVGLMAIAIGQSHSVWAAQQTAVSAEASQAGQGQRIAPVTSRLFAEPLFPTSPSSSAEKAALLEVLAKFDKAGDPLNRQPLEAFLEQHPDSVWKSAILGNLGLASAFAGRYTQALSDWKAAWEAGKSAEQIQVRAFVDRIMGERLQLLTRLGNQEAVSALLAETEGRTLLGSASEAFTSAREGLWLMQNKPETAFLCGPLALEQLMPNRQPGALMSRPIGSLPAMSGGYTLAALEGLAKEKGLDLAPVQRTKGQDIPVPSVIHWKSGHYAALIAQEGDRYLVRDPVMNQEVWQTRETLELESSGYFLAPEKQLAAAGWRAVDGKEA